LANWKNVNACVEKNKNNCKKTWMGQRTLRI
jgi:hypothetical protein